MAPIPLGGCKKVVQWKSRYFYFLPPHQCTGIATPLYLWNKYTRGVNISCVWYRYKMYDKIFILLCLRKGEKIYLNDKDLCEWREGKKRNEWKKKKKREKNKKNEEREEEKSGGIRKGGC